MRGRKPELTGDPSAVTGGAPPARLCVAANRSPPDVAGWVISRHRKAFSPCPLNPQERPSCQRANMRTSLTVSRTATARWPPQALVATKAPQRPDRGLLMRFSGRGLPQTAPEGRTATASRGGRPFYRCRKVEVSFICSSASVAGLAQPRRVRRQRIRRERAIRDRDVARTGAGCRR